ncbi:hypothetical protein AAXB25_06095 [Paenibacillus lautus]|uniref:hypothetical protein n=1 Tax=Paenibacillus lautus TaxID=1401 RepID=UPI003D2A94A0
MSRLANYKTTWLDISEEELGIAMIHTATSGYAKPVLEPAYNLSLAEPKKDFRFVSVSRKSFLS